MGRHLASKGGKTGPSGSLLSGTGSRRNLGEEAPREQGPRERHPTEYIDNTQDEKKKVGHPVVRTKEKLRRGQTETVASVVMEALLPVTLSDWRSQVGSAGVWEHSDAGRSNSLCGPGRC